MGVCYLQLTVNFGVDLHEIGDQQPHLVGKTLSRVIRAATHAEMRGTHGHRIETKVGVVNLGQKYEHKRKA